MNLRQLYKVTSASYFYQTHPQDAWVKGHYAVLTIPVKALLKHNHWGCASLRQPDGHTEQ